MIPAAHAVLDFSALRHNVERVREYARGAKIMAVIKANGYGHGLERIADALSTIDAFAVARVDEGVRLREAGIGQRIVVLEGFCQHNELDLLRRFGLEPVIHDASQIDLLESVAVTQSLSVWLKLDSGMHRLGFDAEEFTAAYRRLNDCQAVRQPISLMTHLAKADDLDDDTTSRQVQQFKRVTTGFAGECSIANSAGIMGWSDIHADWVRPGIMLFGVSPFSDKNGGDHGLKPVMTLHSRLLAIKNLQTGDAVGYGGEWVCSRPMRMGIVAVGYGDGYPRSAVSGTPVLVNGQRVELIGRVSMDMISVDLSECASAKVGDSVVLWGEDLPVEEIAKYASTIPYTLLCGVTQRVRIIEEQWAAQDAVVKESRA